MVIVAEPFARQFGGMASEDPTPPSKRLLLVLAHPALERSRANRPLAKAAKTLDGVSFHDLYEAYPDFLIDVEAEQARLVAHDVIVLQFPMQWYSAPALLKEWIDMVWLRGFAYGVGGTALRGKTLLVAATAGSPKDDYRPEGSHFYSTAEFLRPWERTAALCGMAWAEPFILHSSRAKEMEVLITEARAYRARLAQLLSQGAPA